MVRETAYLDPRRKLVEATADWLCGRAHGVPGGENTVVLDDGSIRYYTVRESARIQTFPDDYLFSASWTESMRQIGNAVPVKLAAAVGKSVYDQMERMKKNGKQRHPADFCRVIP